MTSLRSLTVLNNSLLEVDLLYVSNDAAAAAEEEEERSFVHIPPGEARTQHRPLQSTSGGAVRVRMARC